MSRAEMSNYRKQLETLLGRLDRGQRQLKQEALQSSGGEASGGISNVPLHPGDLGSHESEEAMSFQLMMGEELTIKEIQDALDRMEQGRFGHCEACDGAISRERLRALPQSRYCIHCAQEFEHTPGG